MNDILCLETQQPEGLNFEWIAGVWIGAGVKAGQEPRPHLSHIHGEHRKHGGINWRNSHDCDKFVKQAVWHLGLNSCLEARYSILGSILRKDHSHVLTATNCL